MSKKIAEGIEAVVLDVKTGRGAFMKTESEARGLAQSLVAIGRSFGLRAEAILTAMDAPLGLAVGNASEVIEALEVLKGRGPADVAQLSFVLSERLLVMAGLAADPAVARAMVRSAIDSGSALEKFRVIIERQGGDARVVDDYGRLPHAPGLHVVNAQRPGYVGSLDAELIGRASVLLGGGRDRIDDEIDPGVAIVVKAPVGTEVRAGEAVLELRYREERRLDAARSLIARAIDITPQPPPARPLILGEVP
jgi:thymidine phosphorylase